MTSFKVAISDVLVCNDALALLPADPITRIDEQSLEARECRRSYKSVVAELLEKHHWGLATKRVTLAQMVNDRAEWAFAYAKPADMAFPVAVGGPGGNFTGWYYADGVYSVLGKPLFIQVGDVIYSRVAMAVLEYTSFNITEAAFTHLFKRIVALELAARICHPVTKNSARAKELAGFAEGERQRVIANDLNRSQPTYGNRATESELARFGIVGNPEAEGWGPGQAIDPVTDPIGAVILPDGAAPGNFYYEG